MSDNPTYEIDIPPMASADIEKFKEDVMGGRGKLWMVLTEEQEDFRRYRGVLFSKTGKWISVFIDMGIDYCYVTIPERDGGISEYDVAKEVRDAMGGSKIYHDGVKIKDGN
jgi:hypothetical protein